MPADLHHLLGDVDEKLGDSLEAVRHYQRAAELDPSEPHLLDWGAELLLHHAPAPAGEVFAKGSHYGQLAKESAQKKDRERREIKQFVYTLRDQPATQLQ